MRRRIKSAGATLRRHGEQQLQNEVRSLLASWRDALAGVQCIYMRCNLRERRDLLVGWDGSPLASFAATGRLRNIPFPTRRATLKEVTRCYDELMTVVSATTSAVESLPVATKAVKPSTTAPKQTVPQEQPKEKGTAHLKKRVEKPSEPSVAVAALETARVTDEEPELELLPVEALVLTLLKACVGGDISTLQSLLDGDAPLCEKSVLFHRGYLKEVDALADLGDAELGLVGAATVTANMESINWLLDQGVPPNVGASPYLTTKSKAARTALRRYWGLHADSTLDFAGAGVPSPLTDADADAAAAKRRRERAKKKIRKDLREEEGKPADVRAREARAAAAELRLGIGARACALCRKSLAGKVPFERLAFKYCSTDCVSQHKERLAADAQKARRS
jgi:Bacteroidetes VLRF1 release factor/Vms1-associating treble clef domain